MQINQLIEAKNELDAEKQFIESLKENPLMESEALEITKRASGNQKHKIISLLADLRKQGLVVADPPLSFDEFKESNKGRESIKATTLQQMTRDEFRTLRKDSSFSVYSDIPEGSQVVHYRYIDMNGRTRETGSGMRVSIKDWTRNDDGTQRKSYTPEETSEIQKQESAFRQARQEITELMERLRSNQEKAGSPVFS